VESTSGKKIKEKKEVIGAGRISSLGATVSRARQPLRSFFSIFARCLSAVLNSNDHSIKSPFTPRERGGMG
jgi:hypothetical protein